jgi:hypothetical protein
MTIVSPAHADAEPPVDEPPAGPRSASRRPARLGPVLIGASVLTVVLAVVAGATVIALPWAETPAAGVGAPPGPARCLPTYDGEAAPPADPGRGQLVPAGVVGALLCVYAFTDTTRYLPLTEQVPLPDGAGGLADALNGLPDAPGGSPACALAGQPQHRVVFSYADRGPVTVEISGACGLVFRDRVVRRLASLRDILERWGR